MYLQRQLMVFVAITRVTRSPCQHNRRSALCTHLMITIMNDLAYFSLTHNSHLEIRGAIATVIFVLHRQAHPPLDQGTVFVEPYTVFFFKKKLSGWLSI